ncbi:MAG: MBL fold metallo-hydrolase, partial [Chloroflexota bacterium]
SGLMVGRVYLLTEGDGLTLIDTSIASAGKKILAQLQENGFSAGDIKRILITHAHPDHVGSVHELVQATGAQQVVPDGEKSVYEGEIPIPSGEGWLQPPQTTLENLKADQTLKDGDVLSDVMGGLHVIATPGHTMGHSAYWQPERKILFCGDTIFNAPRTRLPLRAPTVNMAENIRSIAKLEPLKPDVICFGHGKPITENAAQRLTAFAKKVGAI